MTDKSDNISVQIKEIFEQNEIENLKRYLVQRHNLNRWNSKMNYLFHFIQSVGVLTTTIAAGYDQKYLIWVGVGLNMFASLINIYEKTNNKLLDKLMADIQKIKDGTYVDEGKFIDTNKNNSSNNTKPSLDSDY